MKQYLEAVREVLDRGTRKENRTGVDTLAAFNLNYAFDLAEGFPLLTTKQISWKNIVVENLWFLSGVPHIELLQRHGCKFWDPWADERGYVPSAYGYFWRNFPEPCVCDFEDKAMPGRLGLKSGEGGAPGQTQEPGSRPSSSFNDQVRWVLNEIARNPDSRRLVVSAWQPTNAQNSKLPPCHLLYIFNVQYTPEGEPRLNLHLTQRSCDLALGVPYNIAGYSFILELFSRFTGIKAGTFGHTLVDAHVYTAKADGSMAKYDHVPKLREQLARPLRPLPRLEIAPEIETLEDVLALTAPAISTATLLEKFKLVGYDPHPPLTFKVAV